MKGLIVALQAPFWRTTALNRSICLPLIRVDATLNYFRTACGGALLTRVLVCTAVSLLSARNDAKVDAHGHGGLVCLLVLAAV